MQNETEEVRSVMQNKTEVVKSVKQNRQRLAALSS